MGCLVELSQQPLCFLLRQPMRGLPALYGMKRHNQKAEPQAAFLKVEPRATRPDSCPLPVTDHSVPHCGRRPIPTIRLPPNFEALQFSRKLGCGVYTKCPDSHPKQERLGSSNMAALRSRREPALHRRGLVGSSEVRSLPPLQTMYQLPSHQQCRRLPHHSLQPQSGV
jgi:hypothetical protein